MLSPFLTPLHTNGVVFSETSAVLEVHWHS